MVSNAIPVPFAGNSNPHQRGKRVGALALTLCLLFSTLAGRADEAAEGWFTFDPSPEVFAESVIDMSDWLDGPAGKHGWVVRDGDRLVFEDTGARARFWGVNHFAFRLDPPPESAERYANLFAKYGINFVRLHKIAWTGRDRSGMGSPETCTELVPEKLARFDYMVSRFREKGIYYGWSAIWGLRPMPGDRDKILAYDEIAANGSDESPWLAGTTLGLVHFAEDLQDLKIEFYRNFLNHRNPHTGLRYADDPALAFIEIQNEDDIFFPTTEAYVEQCPTYKAMFCQLFSDWLRNKYGTHAGLVAAWGEAALDTFPHRMTGEHLDKGNIYPMANAWFFGEEGMDETRKRRLLDTARFLYETQNAYYGRLVRAIRETGFGGHIVASGWQAGEGISHYYNLHSDYLHGIIDRHNYWAQGMGWSVSPGRINNQSMLSRPGSGLLSTGMQQVEDRPFALSEWMAALPNEWIAEAPAIIAAYGMGLQGWDNSHAMGVEADRFTPTVQGPNVFNVCQPSQLGTYPAISRMVLRGDVQEGEVISRRNVHVPSLLDGYIGFRDHVEHDGDVKSFGGEVPREALAAGRIVVSFKDEWSPTQPVDLGELWDHENRVISSNTGQLEWHYGDPGREPVFFSVNTAGTQAVVGFSGGQSVELGDVIVEPETRFSLIFLTSLDKEKPISEADRLLLTTIGRARNTGMSYSEDGEQLLTAGQAPVMLEGIQARLRFKTRIPPSIRVLDPIGRRTGRTVPVMNGVVELDGARDRALYYEIEFR